MPEDDKETTTSGGGEGAEVNVNVGEPQGGEAGGGEGNAEEEGGTE